MDEIAVNATVDINAVKAVLVRTLGIEDRASDLGPSTPLLGSLPELDSMAVLELIVELERSFGIGVADEEVSAEAFETLESLAEFVDRSSPR